MKIDRSINVIDFGTRKITYNLHREDRKRMRIVVSPELTVDVFAPAIADKDQIQAAVMKKAAWIARKIDALERYHPLPAPKKYTSGETLVYLGRQYRLKVERGRSQPAKLMGRFLRVWVEDKSDTRSVRKKVDAWYRKRAHLAAFFKTMFSSTFCGMFINAIQDQLFPFNRKLIKGTRTQMKIFFGAAIQGAHNREERAAVHRLIITCRP
jgi:hypothetical protein